MKDVFEWCVTYTDGTIIREYDREDGRGFAEVDHTQVRQITLSSDGTTHAVEVPEGAMPVLFRRRSIELGPIAGEGQNRRTVHCIGWKREDQAVYLFVYDDGSTLLSSDLQAV